MVNNAYIHIPFCKSKCKYCSFISFPQIEKKEAYLVALQKEIKHFYQGESLNTIYFGGGTPSLLEPDEFRKILALFNTHEKTEITVEINPENITEDYLKKLKKIGINRLSTGSQTFNKDILKLTGRRHTPQDIINTVKYAQNNGFNNISLDFIYGLPKQTMQIFKNDLFNAVSLGIQHVSLYGLKIDEGCYFYSHRPENIADDDLQAEMYLAAIQILKQYGFEHYEISNFARKGFESRHNLNYWDNNMYYGFGLSAHGYENEIRYYNTSNLKNYIQDTPARKYEHKLSIQEQLEEEIFLGFRKIEGINIEKINKKFNIDFLKKYAVIINKYISYKYLKETNTGFTLTNEGILISNTILSEFLE